MKTNYSKLSDSFPFPTQQKGMVLIVGLVMVLLLTVIGLAAIRGSGMQEIMASNMRDKNIALQAAESALRVCESDITPNKSLPDPTKYLCGLTGDLNSSPENSVINNEAGWLAISLPLTSMALENVASQPRGTLEKLYFDRVSYGAMHGSSIGVQGTRNQIDYDNYRVTTKGFGAADTTQAVLQTTYTR